MPVRFLVILLSELEPGHRIFTAGDDHLAHLPAYLGIRWDGNAHTRPQFVFFGQFGIVMIDGEEPGLMRIDEPPWSCPGAELVPQSFEQSSVPLVLFSFRFP